MTSLVTQTAMNHWVSVHNIGSDIGHGMICTNIHSDDWEKKYVLDWFVCRRNYSGGWGFLWPLLSACFILQVKTRKFRILRESALDLPGWDLSQKSVRRGNGQKNCIHRQQDELSGGWEGNLKEHMKWSQMFLRKNFGWTGCLFELEGVREPWGE